MSDADAMLRYGTDRPDLRVELELADFSECFADTGFRVFADALGRGDRVRGLVAPGGGATLSRRELDELVSFATGEGAGGLTWIRIGADGWQSPAVKFLGDSERERLTAAGKLETGDLLVVPGRARRACGRPSPLAAPHPPGSDWARDGGRRPLSLGGRLPLLERDEDAGSVHSGASSVHRAADDDDPRSAGARAASPCARRPSDRC
jgi:hypothetical protein